MFLVWLSLSKLNRDDIEEVKKIFTATDYWWISLSIALGIISHLSRAYRWLLVLKPMGYHAKFSNSFMAVMTGYLVNLGIPRAGELFRASVMKKYENLPIEKGLGTVVAERIADVIMYGLCIGIALFFQYDLILENILKKIPQNPLSLIVLGIGLLALGVVLLFLIKKKKPHLFQKLKKMAWSFWEGIKSILTMEKKVAFVAHTLLIWVLYVGMIYVIIGAFEQTQSLSFGAVMVCFVMGTLSYATTNGGVGAYPLIIQQTLLIYSIDSIVGLSLGWLIWIAQTLMIVVLGLISFVLLPVVNRKKSP